MKLHEITTAPGTDAKRLIMLKLMADRGHKPEIANATYMKGHFAWGDLEQLGYATRGSKRTAHGMEEWWTYTGPTPIVLITNAGTKAEERHEMDKGDSTPPIEVDYS